MNSGRFKIANQDFVIKQLGSAYSNVGEAFKEYTTNAVDAIYQTGINNGFIHLIVNQNERWVLVQDNGIGMDYEKLSKLPEMLGESAKRLAKSQSGEKGLGNLAYLRLKADKLYFISRDNREEGLVNLLRADSHLNYWIKSIRPDQINLPDVVRQLVTAKLSRGTIVFLENIDSNIMEKNFLPHKLTSLISEMYNPILEQKKIDISISYIGKNGKSKPYQPEPLTFDGEQVFSYGDFRHVEGVKLKDGKIGKGKIDFFIKVDPQSNDKKIRVYHKGVKVNNITEIEYLNKEPWNLGKLDGYIDEDFLTLTLPRNSFEFNENLNLWLPVINEMGDHLNLVLKQYRSKGDKNSYEIADKVMRAIDVIYRKMELKKFFSRKRIKKDKTVETEVNPDINKDDEDNDEGYIPITQRGPRLTVPFVPDFDSFGINEEDLRSRLVGKFIKVNKNHRDYKKYFEDKTDLERAEYLLDLLSKEIGFAAAKSLLSKDSEERPSIDDIVLKTKEIASDIYYGAQKQLELSIKGKL